MSLKKKNLSPSQLPAREKQILLYILKKTQTAKQKATLSSL